jgi:excinuclease ABC subunit B
VKKSIEQIMQQTSVLDIKGFDAGKSYAIDHDADIVQVAAEEGEILKPELTIPQMEKQISTVKKRMEQAARDLDFIEAARLRDEMFKLQKELDTVKQ